MKAVKFAGTVIGLEETLYDMFDCLAIPLEKQKDLFEYAKEKGLVLSKALQKK